MPTNTLWTKVRVHPSQHCCERLIHGSGGGVGGAAVVENEMAIAQAQQDQSETTALLNVHKLQCVA